MGKKHIGIRYGAFNDSLGYLDCTGQRVVCVRTPTGALEKDERSNTGVQPYWAPLPIIAQKPELEPEETHCSIRVGTEEFLSFAVLNKSAKGSVRLCARKAPPHDTVILKTAVGGVNGDFSGIDAKILLSRENQILRHLRAAGCRVPTAIFFEDLGPKANLICEDIVGETLIDLPSDAQAAALPAMAHAVHILHQSGIAHRDLKLTNAILSDTGDVYLIDFELAARLGEQNASPGGTLGYFVSGQANTSSVQRDCAALASCAGAVALQSHDLSNVSPNELVSQLMLNGFYEQARLIERTLSDDSLSADDVAEVIAQIDVWKAAPPASSSSSLVWAKKAACDSVAHLKRLHAPTTDRHLWIPYAEQSQMNGESLVSGATGVALALATLQDTVGVDTALATQQTCQWLSERTPPEKAAGLFTGNAGVALALATFGRRYNNAQWLRAADLRLESAVSGGMQDPDLFMGAAGVVWGGVLIAQVLGSPRPLAQVAELVDWLRAQRRQQVDLVYWPHGGSLDDKDTAYVGAAHGIAGIALALCAYAEATQDMALAQESIACLEGIYLYCRTKGEALRTRVESDTAAPQTTWCHGVAGYLWCLLQSGAKSPILTKATQWCVTQLQQQPIAGGTTLCHGASGMLAVWRMLGPDYLPYAMRAATFLRMNIRPTHGAPCWPSFTRDDCTPALWAGYLGPSTELALLSAGNSNAVISSHWLYSLSKEIG